MKRIFIFLLIATFSITGLYAQQTEADKMQAKQKNEQDLKVYQQKQAQELKEAIRAQTELHIMEAAKRMESEKMEVQKDLQARREQLMNRPAGMVALSEEVRLRSNL